MKQERMGNIGIVDVYTPKSDFYHAAIQVRGSIFNLRNVYEEGTGHTHIDISDDNGKFLDEFDSGFGVESMQNVDEFEKVIAEAKEDDGDIELNLVKVYEYIDNHLVF